MFSSLHIEDCFWDTKKFRDQSIHSFCFRPHFTANADTFVNLYAEFKPSKEYLICSRRLALRVVRSHLPYKLSQLRVFAVNKQETFILNDAGKMQILSKLFGVVD